MAESSEVSDVSAPDEARGRVAFVFPGQGSQVVGMGADAYAASAAARAVFDAADQALGFALSRLCFEGPEDELRQTVNTQPALVATSLALLAALQEAAGASANPTTPAGDSAALRAPLTPAFVAGHSVGEYAALAAAGALGVAETLRLARERGRLMHTEGQTIPSGMAAVLGMDAAALEPICAEATSETQAELAAAGETSAHPGMGRVVIANDNAPGQVVISGEQRALERAMALAKARGAKRVVPLAVSGAFHSPVMSPAATGLAQALSGAPLREAVIPIISNITATPITSAEALRDELARQVISPVRWTDSIRYLESQGVTTLVEIGAGQVLSGLTKRIARGVTTFAVGTYAEAVSVAQRLRDEGL